MKKSILLFSILFFAIVGFTGFKNAGRIKDKKGTVKITFVNTVKGNPIELNKGTYTNPFGETYSISKFKYYVSRISLAFAGGNFIEPESYHLINESEPEDLSFTFELNTGNYQSLSFLLGVDSLKNVSGAQTDALDPLNDMFWTWNSGYIMAKMEGNSPQSKVVNKKVEFHIGGFSGAYNVLKNIKLDFSAATTLIISSEKTSEIVIEADFDTWWQNPNAIKIADHSVCTTPGALAMQFADNYAKMFTIKKVTNN